MPKFVIYDYYYVPLPGPGPIRECIPSSRIAFFTSVSAAVSVGKASSQTFELLNSSTTSNAQSFSSSNR